MSQRSSHDDRQSSSAESGQESGELSAEPSVKKARVDDASKPISPEKAWNYAEDDSTGSDKSRSPEAQLAADKEDDVEGTSRWVDDDVGNNEASDSQDEEAQADKSPVDDHRDDEPSASDADTAPKLLDMLQQCRNKDEIFEILKEIGSGTYGSVSKARNKLTNEIKALKKIKLPGTFACDGFPMTSVREINLLLALDHPNIVQVCEIVIGKKRDVYMVMEFVQQDLKAFLAKYKSRLKIGEVKRIVRQMLEGMRYLHENWVLHRDLKPANVLYDHLGNIKICDFGLARHFGNPVPNMTPTVVTPTYRGPEICLGVRDYTPALDIWSVGIMAAELISGKTPFIEYKSELDLVIGSPHGRWEGLEELPNYKKLNIEKDVPSTLRQRLGVQGESALPLVLDTALTECGYDLLERMLRWDPRERLSAAEALEHPWFQELPREVQACFMPQTNDALRRKYA